jgi:hypothetical protein
MSPISAPDFVQLHAFLAEYSEEILKISCHIPEGKKKTKEIMHPLVLVHYELKAKEPG